VEFECLNCCERINPEELIDGRCPICGWHHAEQGSKAPEIDPSLLTLFCQFVSRIEDSLVRQPSEDSGGGQASRIFYRNLSYRKPVHSFNLATTRLDRIRIKKCHYCGRYHVRVGNKLLEVRQSGPTSTYRKLYVCPACEHSRSLGQRYYVNQMANP
jgi:hypothetical protein